VCVKGAFHDRAKVCVKGAFHRAVDCSSNSKIITIIHLTSTAIYGKQKLFLFPFCPPFLKKSNCIIIYTIIKVCVIGAFHRAYITFFLMHVFGNDGFSS
jgi:hypothetical protein